MLRYHPIAVLLCVYLTVSQAASKDLQNSSRSLHARTKISGIRPSRDPIPLAMAGRCDRLQINDLKELLRKISQWSQWAIDVTPQSSERARLVTREERWFFERHFGNYDVGNRNSVRQRFELLQSEVDHSPGGRFRWIPGRGKAKLRCHAQTEYLCADPEQWSQQDPYLARVGQIVLVKFNSLSRII